MKTKGSTSYSGVPLKDLNKYFKEDAVIQVSKKFLDIHKLVSGDSRTHIQLSVDKEEEAVPGIVVKEADPEKLEKLSKEKPQEQAVVSKLETW